MRSLLIFLAACLLLSSFTGCAGKGKVSALDSELILVCGSGGTTPEDVKALLNKGANVNAQLYEGTTALHMACSVFNKGVIRALVSMGADVNAADSVGNTPLHEIVAYGDRVLPEVKEIAVAIARFLLENGADINAVNSNGKTPLGLVQSNEQMASLLKAWGGV